MLAYAAQGLEGDVGSRSGDELQDYLKKADEALNGLAEAIGSVVASAKLEPQEHYQAFVEVIDRDARAAQAAFRLVLCQPSIGSQLIDNLNASIHVRTLLTDLFLIDEILKKRLPSS